MSSSSSNSNRCYQFSSTFSSSSSSSFGSGTGSANSSIVACGNVGFSVYESCCGIGDLCLAEGLCQTDGNTDFRDAYYIGGCTDSSGESGACPGSCPTGYPQLTWDDEGQDWLCCPSSTSLLSKCSFPLTGGTYFQNIPPSQLYATASIVGSSSVTPLPTRAVASASRSAYSAAVYPTSSDYYNNYYSSYYYNSYYSEPTSSSTAVPNNNSPLGGSAYNPGACEEALDCPGPLSLLLVVTIIPSIVVTLLVVLAIWLCVRADRKRRNQQPYVYPGPNGLPLGQVIYQAGQVPMLVQPLPPGVMPQAAINEKMPTANGGAQQQQQQQPAQGQSQLLQPPAPVYGSRSPTPQQTTEAPKEQNEGTRDFLQPVTPLAPLEEPKVDGASQQAGAGAGAGAGGEEESTSRDRPEAPEHSPPLPPREEQPTATESAREAPASQATDGQAAAPNVPSVEITPADKHHQEYYA